MRFPFQLILLFLIRTTGNAQDYTNVVRHRPILTTQVNLTYRTAGKWSFQLDHLVWRQADDTDGRDLNLLRYPLLEGFRPWVNYQPNKQLKLSLSPLSLWWSWNQTGRSSRITFQEDTRVIPQLIFTSPRRNGTFVIRLRGEFRWRSWPDTLLHTYDFLGDDQHPINQFEVRPWLMLRWVKPLSHRKPADQNWYMQSSVETINIFAPGNTYSDQNRFYLSFGRRVGDNVRLEMGLMSSLAVRRNEATHIRTFRFNHALTLNLSLQNRQRPKNRPGAIPL